MNYSPLRYPGGKSKLAPLIYSIMQKTGKNYQTYIEPFAGGAGVALTLLLENKVENIVINDYDKAVYSFWRAVKEDTACLLKMIDETPLSIEEWHKQKNIYANNNHRYSVKLGFAAFYLNRTNRSGIMKGGPIGGMSQSGDYLIDARFNRVALAHRIKEIAKRKNDIHIYNKEVRSFIKNVIPKYQAHGFVYFDPPYYQKGHELYKNFFMPTDHEDIASAIVKNLDCDWIITYDDVPEIEKLYHRCHMKKITLRYSLSSTSPNGSEILIFKDAQHCPSSTQMSNSKFKFA